MKEIQSLLIDKILEYGTFLANSDSLYPVSEYLKLFNIPSKVIKNNTVLNTFVVRYLIEEPFKLKNDGDKNNF
jgi:hypothetical protein